jgi:hypothetical protein
MIGMAIFLKKFVEELRFHDEGWRREDPGCGTRDVHRVLLWQRDRVVFGMPMGSVPGVTEVCLMYDVMNQELSR